MIELAFIACLSAEPAACEKKSLVYTEMTPMTCIMRAQPVLAEWSETHPGWTIARWTCGRVKPGKDV